MRCPLYALLPLPSTFIAEDAAKHGLPPVAPALTAAGFQHTLLTCNLGGNNFCTLVRISDWNKKSQKPTIFQDILRFLEISRFLNLLNSHFLKSQDKQNYQEIIFKVWIFWEGHRKIFHLKCDVTEYIVSNFKWKIFEILWPSQDIRTLLSREIATKEFCNRGGGLSAAI